MSDQASYELSADQKRFVAKAKRNGLKVRWDYSGRGMYGKQCPAVVVNHPTEFSFKEASIDNMGLGYVIYVR